MKIRLHFAISKDGFVFFGGIEHKGYSYIPSTFENCKHYFTELDIAHETDEQKIIGTLKQND